MAPRFVLVDAALEGLGGHYLEYARTVLDAAGALELDTTLAIQRDAAPQEIGGHRVVRCLSQSYWENFFAVADSSAGFLTDARRFASRSLDITLGEGWRQRTSRWLTWAAMATLMPVGLLHSALTRFTPFHFLRAARKLTADLQELSENLGGLTADDLVFIPSAGAVELLAVARFVRARGFAGVRFALLFRRDPDHEANTDRSAIVRRLDRLGYAARRLPPTAPVQLYSDTQALAMRYAQIVGDRVGVAPIPVVSARSAPHPRDARNPMVVTYLGDARREKGFHLLPAIVHASPPSVHFRIQSNLSEPGDLECLLARTALAAQPRVKLLTGPFSAAEYRALVATSDVIVMPYDPVAYRRRSSGVYVEAIANGVPVIVTAGTWMAEQLDLIGGQAGLVAEPDPAALADAIVEVTSRGLELSTATKAISPNWAKAHSGAALLEVLRAGFRPAPELVSAEPGCGADND